MISDNAFHGIAVVGGSDATKITGNFVGTDRLGTAALGTQQSGIVESGIDRTVIGGTAPGEGNVLSAETPIAGADVVTAKVLGNILGTDVNGTTAIPNGNSGIQVVRRGADRRHRRRRRQPDQRQRARTACS